MHEEIKIRSHSRNGCYYSVHIFLFSRLLTKNILTYLLTYLLHGAESFLRSKPVLNQSIFPHFMAPAGSLSHFQVPTTCPYPESTPPSHFLRSSFILTSHLRLSSKQSLSLRCPIQNPEYTSPLPHTCYMPRPSHSSQFYHPNNIW